MSKALNARPQNPGFAQRLVRWQKQHGRHDLPWQGTSDPYRVWLSEIMLQQTQVATVKSYYQRFLARFPSVSDLALASIDEVMALWTGLGYYSRARNLHRCAQQVQSEWQGVFPRRSADLETLAGIGPSTAAAIASICHRERVAIFDGNVQRVLARHGAHRGDLAQTRVLRELRERAEAVLPPAASMPTYTQAIMDLGATVCTPRVPACGRCPVASDCQALAQGLTTTLPIKTRKLKRQSQSWWLLLVQHPRHGFWLQRRPAQGIWAGLYCVPIYPSREALLGAVPAHLQGHVHESAPVLHVLTHRDLHLHWCEVQCGSQADWLPDGDWHPAGAWDRLGLPKPVIDRLQSAHGGV